MMRCGLLALFVLIHCVNANETQVTPLATKIDIERVSVKDFEKFRDPFKRPEEDEESDSGKMGVEKYPVADLKLLGVMSGPLRKRAMVRAPDNKTYFISENMKIGLRDGIVKKITTRTVQVQEKIINAIGEVENVDIELNLESKDKKR